MIHAPDPSKRPVTHPDDVGAWRWGAVCGLILAAGLILVSGDVDRCEGMVTSFVVSIGWLFAPAVSIACVAVVAVKTRDRIERWLTGVVTVALTVGWLVSISWVSLGTAMHTMGC